MYTSIYNPYVPQEAFLAHHGIRGQRWGKKNGPPYPLSAGAHSASEKKAGWRKSLAGGVAGVGRGTVKVAKAVGRGSKKVAKALNKAAVRANLKPTKLMTDEELAYSIERVKQTKRYQNALKGKFGDINKNEESAGKKAFKYAMESIGKEVLMPTVNGVLRYKLATAISPHAEGEKVASMIETISNGGKSIGFRNNFFYDSDGNPIFRAKEGKNNQQGQNKPKENKPKEEKPKEKSNNPFKKESKADTPKEEASRKEVKVDTPKEETKPKSQSLTERIASLNKSVEEIPRTPSVTRKQAEPKVTAEQKKIADIWKTVEPFKTNNVGIDKPSTNKAVKESGKMSIKEAGTYWPNATINDVRDLGGKKVEQTLSQRIRDLDAKIVKSRNKR